MPQPFSSATAEQVVAVVEAVVVAGAPTKPEFVADFSDLPQPQAEEALKLSIDLGLLTHNAGRYVPSNPLCRFLVTPNQMQKAAVLRVLLESYKPFVVFRERLVATTLASNAAQQTKVALDLNAHRENIKDTLVSLGTYSHALITEGGGRYRPETNPTENLLEIVAQGCQDAAAAEARIRQQVGVDAAALISRDDVIVPLADALLRARGGDGRGAVLAAGNAVESYLEAYAGRRNVAVAGATGINAKIDRLSQGNVMPRKLAFSGKYLGHIRNAADHGVDTDVGASWTIRGNTGTEYVFVACSFIAGVTAYEGGKPPEI